MGEQQIFRQIAEAIRHEIQEGRYKPGDRLPSIREMTGVWGCSPGTVQRAYRELAEQGLIVSRAGQGTHVVQIVQQEKDTPLRRANLVHRAQAFLLEAFTAGHTTEEVETAMRLAIDQWRIIRDQPAPKVENILRFSGSHDLALTWIAAHFSEISRGTTLEMCFTGSLGGLIALAEGKADLAGCHLWDHETDSYNIPYVRRLLPGRRTALVNLAWRRQGLITPAGNPQKIMQLTDLTRSGLQFINRQPGSGTRVWLDAAMKRAGISTDPIAGYQDIRHTHSEVARAVAEGKADAGFGLETAALAFGLSFVPLVRERYDLVIPEQTLELDAVKRLVDWLGQMPSHQAITALGGYNTRDTGKIIWISN